MWGPGGLQAVELLGKSGADGTAVNRYREPPLALTDDAIMIRMLKVWLETSCMHARMPATCC